MRCTRRAHEQWSFLARHPTLQQSRRFEPRNGAPMPHLSPSFGLRPSILVLFFGTACSDYAFHGPKEVEKGEEASVAAQIATYRLLDAVTAHQRQTRDRGSE